MPKVSHRCNRRGRFSSQPVASAAFLAPPRKVSFEDNNLDSDSEPRSPVSSKPVLKALAEESRPKFSLLKSTLKRPKSSLSLVDLAKTVEKEGCNSNSDASTSSSVLTNIAITEPISPVLRSRDVNSLGPSPSSATASPWGHFIDMVIPDETSTSACHAYRNSPCNCCVCYRRRRASPYGPYKAVTKRRPLCFLPDNFLSSDMQQRQPQDPATIDVPTFRLAPRKRNEPTEQLAGALCRLHVE